MIRSITHSYPIFRFSQIIKLSQKQYLDLATRKIHELTSIAQQLEQQDGFDINSTDQILKINYNRHSIVINTQTPNRQLWYSCTISGPQRYDYVASQQGKQIWQNNKGVEIAQQLRNDIKSIMK